MLMGGHISVCMLGMYTHVGGEKCYLVCCLSDCVFCELGAHLLVSVD